MYLKFCELVTINSLIQLICPITIIYQEETL